MTNRSLKGVAAAAWGVGGILALIGSALVRLTPTGIAALEAPLTATQWLLLAVWIPVMVWAEGVRGFHGSFSPTVAARAEHLARHPRPLHIALAPLYCLGLIHATRRRRFRSAALSLGILLIVLLVRVFRQPWRGIVDLGVVAGLSVGVVSMLVWTYRAFGRGGIDHPPEVPVEA